MQQLKFRLNGFWSLIKTNVEKESLIWPSNPHEVGLDLTLNILPGILMHPNTRGRRHTDSERHKPSFKGH